MAKHRKDISRARRMQDEYALAERHFENFKAYAKKIPAHRRASHKRSASLSNPKNEGRVEGFLAGALSQLSRGS